MSHSPLVLMRYTESHLNLGSPKSQLSFQTSYLPVSSTAHQPLPSPPELHLTSHFLYKQTEREANPESDREATQEEFRLSLRPQLADSQAKTVVVSNSEAAAAGTHGPVRC